MQWAFKLAKATFRGHISLFVFHIESMFLIFCSSPNMLEVSNQYLRKN